MLEPYKKNLKSPLLPWTLQQWSLLPFRVNFTTSQNVCPCIFRHGKRPTYILLIFIAVKLYIYIYIV